MYVCMYGLTSDLFIHPKKTECGIFKTSMKLNQIDSVNLSEGCLGGKVLNHAPNLISI